MRGAGLLGELLAAQVGGAVVGQRPGGVAALLGAVMHQAVFTDVEIARAARQRQRLGRPWTMDSWKTLSWA